MDAALVDRQLNLAAAVRDGDKIRVPARGEAAAAREWRERQRAAAAAARGAQRAAAAAAPSTSTTRPPRRSTRCPGVGPATVAKIIAAREKQPFASVDDLLARKVVGAATLEKMRALVTVGP